ncbi:MAG: class I SAM-dependent methyltransferase [Novosphingobium sp.]|nr:class I SAM-dependent methyltransferase [Novosphingobium sp.]
MNQVMLETIACPNCRTSESSVWGHESGFVAVKCSSCGLVYVNPRPREDAISDANKIGLHPGDEKALDVTYRRIPGKIPHYSAILREMFAEERAAGLAVKWLDVGAGYGEFIEAVLATMPPGSEALGIDPMAPKVKVAQSRGLPVYSRELSEVGDGYDVISLINVYSHIPDFDEFGAMLASKLKPGGILFIETGNIAAVTREQFPDTLLLPDHLVFSSLPQMRMIFERLGMDLPLYKETRVDDALWSLKIFAKGILRRRRLDIRLPGRSAFRQVFYKARKRA